MKAHMKIITNNCSKVLSIVLSVWPAQLLLAALLILALPLAASAHALKETNARVTLRDGQVEVRLWVDTNRWKAHLQNNQAWLLGDIRQVMPLEVTTKETNDFFENVLNEETSLVLNNKAVSLKLLSISDAKNTARHHDYSEFVLSAKHSLPIVDQLNIRFPKSLGAVHASFVKPKYQMVAAGNNAQVSFSALEKKVHHVANHIKSSTNEAPTKEKLSSTHSH